MTMALELAPKIKRAKDAPCCEPVVYPDVERAQALVEGWERDVEMARLDEPIEVEGEQVTEKIDTVSGPAVAWSRASSRSSACRCGCPSVPAPSWPSRPSRPTSGGEVVRLVAVAALAAGLVGVALARRSMTAARRSEAMVP